MRRIRDFINQVIINSDLLVTQNVLPPDMRAITESSSLFMRSALTGISHAAEKKEFADDKEIGGLPFEEAIQYLSKKTELNKNEYYALNDKLKFRAFTVSRLNDGDALVKIKKALKKNLEDGDGLSGFLEKTNTELLKIIGMQNIGGGYWETVYRTNVQTAYNVGRALQFQKIPPIALEFIGISDARQSDICREVSKQKIILKPSDDFWKTHYPPLHFNCRSTVRGIYDEAELPKTANTPQVHKVSSGFGTYPIESNTWWDELNAMTERAKKYKIQKEITSAKKILVIDNLSKRGALIDEPTKTQNKFSDEYYEAIRNRKSKSDVKRIAQNTGFSKEDIQAIRNHLFIKKHELYPGEFSRFDSDYQIAQAWMRLENGSHVADDIILLNHEKIELTLMKEKGYSYRQAHEAANTKYNWQEKITHQK